MQHKSRDYPSINYHIIDVITENIMKQFNLSKFYITPCSHLSVFVHGNIVGGIQVGMSLCMADT